MTRKKRQKNKKARQRKRDRSLEASSEESPPVAGAESTAASSAPRSRGSLARASFLRLTVVVGVFSAGLAGILLVSCAYRSVGKLSGRDILALPGEKVDLNAKIEHDGPAFFNPDVAGAKIEFFLDDAVDALPIPEQGPASDDGIEGESIGSAESDDDGFATLEGFSAPDNPGNYLVHLRLAGEHRELMTLRHDDVHLVVSVVAADSPILITDIDNTISQTDLSDTIADEPEKVPPLDGAVATLTEASTSMQIVYISARPTALSRRTKRWLATHGMPPGPSYLRDLSTQFKRNVFSESRYKSDLIRQLKRRWTKIVWGVGNTDGDMEAYLANGIPAILVPANPEIAERHPRAHTAADWTAVRKIILK